MEEEGPSSPLLLVVLDAGTASDEATALELSSAVVVVEVVAPVVAGESLTPAAAAAAAGVGAFTGAKKLPSSSAIPLPFTSVKKRRLASRTA